MIKKIGQILNFNQQFPNPLKALKNQTILVV